MNDLNNETSLLTPEELCDFLKIKMSKFRYMIFKKEINYIKIGRLVRINKSEVEKWLNKNKIYKAK